MVLLAGYRTSSPGYVNKAATSAILDKGPKVSLRNSGEPVFEVFPACLTLETLIMASQVKVKLSRTQPQRLSTGLSPASSVSKRTPKTAFSNVQVPAVRSSSRLRVSQLPVPIAEVNKTTRAKNKLKAKTNSKDPPASTSTSQKTQKPSRKDTPHVPEDGIPEKTSSELHQAIIPPGQIVDNTGNANSITHDQHENRSPDSEDHETIINLASAGLEGSGGIDESGDTQFERDGVNFPGDSVELHDNLPGEALPPSKPGDPWHSAFVELKAMGRRMLKLDKIERDVDSLKNQFQEIAGRTKALENTIQGHTSEVKSLKSSITETTSKIEKQATEIEDLWTYTQDIASKADQRIREIKQAIQENIDKIGKLGDVKAEINKAVEAQIQESLQVFKNEIKKEFGEQLRRNAQATKKEISDVINRNTHDIAYKGLQDQAYYNRHNLVFLGIPEHEHDSAFTQALNFCKSDLHLNKLAIDVAYRMGKQPAQDSKYARPILVKFSKISDRNSVWMRRNDFSQGRRDKHVRIQADIPKQLREDLQILYRVKNAALKSNHYQSVEVKNYKIYLDGAEYCAWELEELPLSLRPSTLATRISDDTLVFYSKHSALSNHYTAPFEVRGRSYANMEQYLAYKRAKLSGKKPLIQKALQAQDPIEAKSILNALRSDHYEEWKKELSTVALEGLQAKFRQNPALGQYLRNTTPLTLGEASTNSRWGVGMSLDDEKVLDKSKWNKQGNLLGRLLMQIRDQMIKERQPSNKQPTSAAPNRKQNTPNPQTESTEKSTKNASASTGNNPAPTNPASNRPVDRQDTHEKTV